MTASSNILLYDQTATAVTNEPVCDALLPFVIVLHLLVGSLHQWISKVDDGDFSQIQDLKFQPNWMNSHHTDEFDKAFISSICAGKKL